MKKLSLCLVLALALATSAFAAEPVPESLVAEELNGQQRIVKTYTLSPSADPQELIEEPFVLEGYRYTFADMVKEENHVEDTISHKETVTVETAKKDLSVVLEALEPTVEYDDGTYSGTLALDHTTLHTEAAGYTTKNYTVTATKTIGPVDRNDMSYVPATTVKDGKTLPLSNVEWQVIGTDLVGETLMPSSYQAVATYSGKVSYSVATGYITTAEYVGDVSRNEVESVTYQVIYLGAEDPDETEEGKAEDKVSLSSAKPYLPYILGALALFVIIILAVLLVRARNEAASLRADVELPEDERKEELE